jgi:hypothetical protein
VAHILFFFIVEKSVFLTSVLWIKLLNEKWNFTQK